MFILFYEISNQIQNQAHQAIVLRNTIRKGDNGYPFSSHLTLAQLRQGSQTEFGWIRYAKNVTKAFERWANDLLYEMQGLKAVFP